MKDENKTEAKPDADQRLVPLRFPFLLHPSSFLLHVAAFLSAGLWYVSFFPLNFGSVAWVALVPWVLLLRAEVSAWQRYGAAYVAGCAFYTLALLWVAVAHEMMRLTWIGLTLYCAAYWPLTVWLVRWLERRGWPLVLSLPTVWIAGEYLRAHLATGFAWYFVGHTQHEWLALIQITDVTGVYGVSALVVAVNAVVIEWVWRAERRGLVRTTLGVAGVLLAVLGYGHYRLATSAFTPGPRVALLQGNLDQRLRNATVKTDADADRARESMGDHFRKLHAQALAQVPRPDLVIYPETSYPQFWTELADGADLGDLHPRHREEIARIPAYFRHKAGSWGTATLLGLDCYVMTTATNERRYNSALLLTATGTVAGRYDKIHRVPFGEYVPFRDWFPWLQQLTPYEGDYGIAVGERWTRFPLCVQGAEYTFGAVICYEDTNPLLARQYVTGARPVDWLVNISNEGWFDGSSEHAAHLAICRFRAIECRRAVVRAVNLGISAVIDSNGAIVALPGPTWTDSVKVATIVSANVPLDTRSSPYAHLGDWLPIGAWIALLVMVGRQWRWGGGKRG